MSTRKEIEDKYIRQIKNIINISDDVRSLGEIMTDDQPIDMEYIKETIDIMVICLKNDLDHMVADDEPEEIDTVFDSDKGNDHILQHPP